MSDALDITDSELAAVGIPRSEVERQLALFRNPPAYAHLIRSCSVGDGIELLEDEAACLAAYERARAGGRLSKFVPASGAASRMFQALLAVRPLASTRSELEELLRQGNMAAQIALEFLDGVAGLPFVDDLRSHFRARGDDLDRVLADDSLTAIVEALVGDRGIGLASLPKGLIPFHRYPDGALSAFEEHLYEAVELVRDDAGRVRLHFTISEEHAPLFQAKLLETRMAIEGDGSTKLLVGFSTQQRSTDTVSVDLANRPFRDAAGRVVFRPGGHGALLENLNQSGADIALVQNIDNIQPARCRPQSLRWKKLLIGRLVRLQEIVAAALRGEDVSVADRAVLARLSPLASNGGVARALDRPLRVCGVVRNTGEPGGGPFWLRGGDGRETKQIVEGAQVDPDDAEQQAVYAGASHFNPALIACGLRNRDGVPFDLNDFVDPRAVLISRKSLEGRDLKALERPGLWNGSMAHWLTVFAEVDPATFTPVKTVVDLLRPEHQVDS